MVVNVTGSTTVGKPLPPDELNKVAEACDEILQLDEAKQINQFFWFTFQGVVPHHANGMADNLQIFHLDIRVNFWFMSKVV